MALHNIFIVSFLCKNFNAKHCISPRIRVQHRSYCTKYRQKCIYIIYKNISIVNKLHSSIEYLYRYILWFKWYKPRYKEHIQYFSYKPWLPKYLSIFLSSTCYSIFIETFRFTLIFRKSYGTLEMCWNFLLKLFGRIDSIFCRWWRSLNNDTCCFHIHYMYAYKQCSRTGLI